MQLSLDKVFVGQELLYKQQPKKENDEVLKLYGEYLKKINKSGKLNPKEIIKKIRHVLWTHAGIARNEKQLKQGLKTITLLKQEVEDKGLRPVGSFTKKIMYLNRTVGMLDLAESIIRGAVERKESRGAHYREDYLKRDDKTYLINILFQKKEKKIILKSEKVPVLSKKFQNALESFEKTTNYGHIE